MENIKVLVVDDHPLLRQGIESLLEGTRGIEIVGQARDGAEALALHEALQPDITLMDIQMPGIDGLEALANIRSRYPEARIIMLTIHLSEIQVRRALKSGACGYLLKSMVQKELEEAIRIVHDGGKYLPAQVAVELATGAPTKLLSDAEIEVLRLVALGLTNKAIGSELGLPDETVKSRMKHILAKLGAKDRTHAVTLGILRGIIEM